MLTIIQGPAGSGKSKQLCAQMVAEAVKQPSASFIAIVPEQSTLMMQRSVVEAHPAHAVMNIDIVSFERLAHKVLEEAGIGEKDILNDTDKVLLLRRILDRCREELVVYRNKVRMHGFAAEMKTVITELKQYAVDDNDLYLMQEKARQSSNLLLYAKLQDIRCVYRAFQNALKERYHTQEDLLQILASLADTSPILRGAHIYMDGFTGFTPIQYKVIAGLLRNAADVSLTLTLPDADAAGEWATTEHFQLSSQTLERLRELAENGKVPMRICKTEQEGHVPDGYVYRAGTRQEEIRFIAGEILRGVQNEGKRFRDYALVCSDMEGYYRVVKDIFAEARIPCFIDYKSDLGNNPLARLLLAAMELIADHFSFHSVFAFLKCGMTNFTMDEINHLENYCLAFGIRGLRAWKEPFVRNRVLKKQKDTEEEQLYEWDLEQLNVLRAGVYEGLREFCQACSGGSRKAEEYSRELKKLLARFHVSEQMQEKARQLASREDQVRSKEYEQIPERIHDLLDHIGSLLQGELVTAREYSDILSGALDDIRVSIIPPSLDAVLVGDLTRTRLDSVDTLFLAGVNEGKLPAPAAEAGLFTRQERDFLKKEKFDLAPTVLENLYTQHFYIYLLFAKPAGRLLLSYACSNETGEELSPSYILEEAQELLPGLKLQMLEPEDPPCWPSLGAEQLAEGIRSILVREESGGKLEDAGIEPHILSLLRYFYIQNPETLQQILSGAFYQNRALPLDPQTVLDLYGERLHGSVSRYETFYTCPFRHFLSYGLDLRERPEYEVKAADVGTIYHNSLERYAEKLKENGWTFRDVSDEDSHRIARECVEESCAGADSDVLTSTERNAFLLKRMIQVTEKTTDVLRLHVKEGLYEPEAYEMAFQEKLGPHMEFRGRIDRVDLYDAGDLYVKIIDYKSGAKKFSIRDIYTGRQMQLVAYLKAAVQEMQKQHPEQHVVPGGVYYYLIQDHFVRSEKEAEERFRMSGLTSCEPEALKAIDTEVKLSQSSKIVEISYGQNGLHSRSHVANEREFENLMAFTGQKILDAGSRILAGETTIAPYYDSGTQNGCTYCEYQDICKFEAGRWGSDYTKVPEKVTTADMEKEIYGRN